MLVCALALGAWPAAGQNKPRPYGPVGLVMSPGATLVRGTQSLAAKPGEVLFSGDSLRTGAAGATFLFCPQKQSATLSNNSEVSLSQESYQVKAGGIQQRRPVSACFLPAAQKLSVASMQHYGVLVARAGSVPPPETTREQRIAALPAPVREELAQKLRTFDAELASAPGDLGALLARASSFESAGLLYDAGEEYREISKQTQGLVWLRAKITEIEGRLEQEQLKKQ